LPCVEDYELRPGMSIKDSFATSIGFSIELFYLYENL